MARVHCYYVYILKCSDNSFYTGVTNNLELRINQHQIGDNPSSYTFNKRPIELSFYEEFQYIDKAIAFEKQLKGWSRKKKQALIDENWEKLKEYSRCLNETSTKAKRYRRSEK